MAEKLFDIIGSVGTLEELDNSEEKQLEAFKKLVHEIDRIFGKKIYAHYFDIRTNHLNEKDWRRSFSINQLLYGMILACTYDRQLHNSFDEILPKLEQLYKESE